MTAEEAKMFAEFVRSEMSHGEAVVRDLAESPTMSTPINDGGPAFPIADSHYANGQVQYGYNGMSLRDWFAGQFLTTVEIIGRADGKEISSACYKMADAMLAAREGK